jgi:hypothetical protein
MRRRNCGGSRKPDQGVGLQQKWPPQPDGVAAKFWRAQAAPGIAGPLKASFLHARSGPEPELSALPGRLRSTLAPASPTLTGLLHFPERPCKADAEASLTAVATECLVHVSEHTHTCCAATSVPARQCYVQGRIETGPDNALGLAFFRRIVKFLRQPEAGDRTGSGGKGIKNRHRTRRHDSSEIVDRRRFRIGAPRPDSRLAADGGNCAQACEERAGTRRQNRCATAKEVHTEAVRSRRILRGHRMGAGLARGLNSFPMLRMDMTAASRSCG